VNLTKKRCEFKIFLNQTAYHLSLAKSISTTKARKKNSHIHSSFFFFNFWNLTHKTEIGTASRWERLVIANHLDQSEYQTYVCAYVGWLFVPFVPLFVSRLRTRTNEPVFFSSPICGFGIFGCMYEKRIVGDPTNCCDSFQLKEKVADFFW
jgi:hypothetical protein